MNRWILFLLFTCTSIFKVDAQEMWGPSHSNYAGQYGLDLNPAPIVGVPYRWEIHFISMDASIINNYMYLKSQSKLISKSFKGESIDDGKLTDHYTKRPNKFGYGSAFVKYPAFIWSDKKWSAAFHLSTRAELSASKVPYHLAKYLKEGFDYDPQQNIPYEVRNAKVAVLNWHELGITFGGVLKDDKEYYVTGGITVNSLYGLNALYLNLDYADYIVPADSLLVVNDIVAEYGHALPENGTGGGDSPLAKRGYGYSFTTGVQVYKNRNDNFYNPCKRSKGEKPYDYRLGVSLIDVGYLKYTSGTRTYAFNHLNTDWYGIDTTSFGGLVQTDSILSEQFYGNYRQSRDQHDLTMYLPTAASVQFDVAFTENYFVNLSVIQRVPLGKNSIRRANQIAVTPRFESRRIEIALPISYYELFRPRVGLSFRFGVFTIGTDMISPLLGLTDSYGADLYFGIAMRNFKSCDGNNRKEVANLKLKIVTPKNN
ncbi:MAG: hypothetical protein IPO63_02325 [Bacteroidetes bacterium]|nr:hypothetical protein [Bacteroidota bacterium]